MCVGVQNVGDEAAAAAEFEVYALQGQVSRSRVQVVKKGNREGWGGWYFECVGHVYVPVDGASMREDATT